MALKLFLFGDVKLAKINEHISEYNKMLRNITHVLGNECEDIMKLVSTENYEVYSSTYNKDEMHFTNEIKQFTNDIKEMSMNVFDKNGQKETYNAALKLYNKGVFSGYLTFLCHETFVSIIEYNGTAITLKGGNLNYPDILSQYHRLEHSLETQHKKEPKKLLIKSLYQKVTILREIFQLYENEMNIKFFQTIRRMSGDPSVDSRLESHLRDYVNSIHKLLPYLRMHFPLDVRTSELNQGLLNEEEMITSQNSFSQLQHAKSMNTIRNAESKFTAKALADGVKHAINVEMAPVLGFFEGATEAVVDIPAVMVKTTTVKTAELAKETVSGVFTEMDQLLYKLLFHPSTYFLVGIMLWFGPEICLRFFKRSLIRIKNVVVSLGGRVIQVSAPGVYYTYNLVRGIFRLRPMPQHQQPQQYQQQYQRHPIVTDQSRITGLQGFRQDRQQEREQEREREREREREEEEERQHRQSRQRRITRLPLDQSYLQGDSLRHLQERPEPPRDYYGNNYYDQQQQPRLQAEQRQRQEEEERYREQRERQRQSEQRERQRQLEEEEEERRRQAPRLSIPSMGRPAPPPGRPPQPPGRPAPPPNLTIPGSQYGSPNLTIPGSQYGSPYNRPYNAPYSRRGFGKPRTQKRRTGKRMSKRMSKRRSKRRNKRISKKRNKQTRSKRRI